MEHATKELSRAVGPFPPLKKWGHLLLRLLRINTRPSVKVYHGFGTPEHMEISGHVLAYAPFKQERFSSRFWNNTLSLLRLFMVKPVAGMDVMLRWCGQQVYATTDDNGYFHLEWSPDDQVAPGWHDVVVALTQDERISGQGRLLVPPPTKYAIASDIDDTFLISHSANLRRRLFVLLTSNARTRQPFDGVVRHYQLLARADGDGAHRPLFYVSSSEWNLYDYIREFVRSYRLPDGVYLLSSLKKISSFWRTGQGRHNLKYQRIARLLLTYPDKQFILLGDDSQQDPVIYKQLVLDFPGRIICVYLRHIRASRLAPTRVHEAAVKASGVEVCYFTHSKTAIAHSERFGLIRIEGDRLSSATKQDQDATEEHSRK